MQRDLGEIKRELEAAASKAGGFVELRYHKKTRTRVAVEKGRVEARPRATARASACACSSDGTLRLRAAARPIERDVLRAPSIGARRRARQSRAGRGASGSALRRRRPRARPLRRRGRRRAASRARSRRRSSSCCGIEAQTRARRPRSTAPRAALQRDVRGEGHRHERRRERLDAPRAPRVPGARPSPEGRRDPGRRAQRRRDRRLGLPLPDARPPEELAEQARGRAVDLLARAAPRGRARARVLLSPSIVGLLDARGDRPHGRGRLRQRGLGRRRASSASASRASSSRCATRARASSPTAPAARCPSTTRACRRRHTVIIRDGMLASYLHDRE